MSERTKPTTHHDLLAAVDALLNPTRIKIWREGATRAEWTNIPSLWDQLQDATGYRATTGTGAASGHWPISGGIVALIIEITSTTTTALREQYDDKPRKQIPDSLRALAAHLAGADPDTWAPWCDTLRDWASRARAALRATPSRPRELWGIPCPLCGARTTQRDQDGETVRTAALTAEWSLVNGIDPHAYHQDTDYVVRAITCIACETAWFRGHDLDALVASMIRDNTTRETLTGA